MLFHHRRHAGQKLAESLTAYRGCAEGLVLALPRGGVPVAWETACSWGRYGRCSARSVGQPTVCPVG